MPQEVEERYLKLLKRQEGKAKELSRKHSKQRSTHKVMKVSSGYLKGRSILSPSDKEVRPMMAKVKNAVFSMLLCRIGASQLPSECRWLDLFAGTGSVGIEALSRGCGLCHFVELDQWTANEVLLRNIGNVGLEADECVVHVENVFDFLSRFSYKSEIIGGPFDFVSVCPPYNNMDFARLVKSLEDSQAISERSFVIIEYPKEVEDHVGPNLGTLSRMVNRTYGRTTVAIYGPADLV